MHKNLTDQGLLIGFLQERYVNRGSRWLEQSLGENTLPLPDPPLRTVTLFADQVRCFRDDFALVVAFAAHVAKIPLQEFSPGAMLKYLYLEEREAKAGDAAG